MASKKVDALVLPAEAAATGEPQVVAGFPGVFSPGKPVTLDELGMNQTEAKKLLKDLNLPLELQKVDQPKRDEPPIAGRHYDADELEAGADVPILPAASRIASAPEGLEIGEKPPPAATAPPLEVEQVREQVTAETQPDEAAS